MSGPNVFKGSKIRKQILFKNNCNMSAAIHQVIDVTLALMLSYVLIYNYNGNQSSKKQMRIVTTLKHATFFSKHMQCELFDKKNRK